VQSQHLLEEKCEEFLKNLTESSPDAAHDLEHVRRVVNNAKKILKGEAADEEVVLAACWLHDCVVLPKDHPDRKEASKLAAGKAASFLEEQDFPSEKIGAVKHAIESHSFSAGMTAETIEAMILQDADRLDAIGAIGIARALMVGGKLDRLLYRRDDPFCDNREPDDGRFTVDHFYQKLLKLPDQMNTAEASRIAERRAEFMRQFLVELKLEISK
jgi:uncharacterized protein